jgi:hypothetical protein
MNRSTQALAEATHRRRENAENSVKRALREARKTQAPVTVTSIAAAAGVSTDFIYRHRELRPQVEALRRARPSSFVAASADDPDIAAADSTLVRRLSQQLAEVRRQRREEIAELHRALEEAQGELLLLRRRLADSTRASDDSCPRQD